MVVNVRQLACAMASAVTALAFLIAPAAVKAQSSAADMLARTYSPRLSLAVDWGPVAAWAGAGATVLVVLVTVLVALGYFEGFRGPRIQITFEPAQPWCRYGTTEQEGSALWVRVGVENRGAAPARGCVGRLIAVTTDGELRHDVDPVQLRWAGLPRARAFDPMDLRRDQREYLNVLYAPEESRWELVTFDDPDFDPGFKTELPVDRRQVFQISVFSDNAKTVSESLVFEPARDGHDRLLKLL